MSNNEWRLLIIDDEAAVRRSLEGLSLRNFKIEEAATGQEGLAKFESFKPDLILLDLGLPDLSGLEVLKRLREWTKIPILILTVRDSEREKVELLDAGADDYLTKPFSFPELIARLNVARRRALSQGEPNFKFSNQDLEIDFRERSVRLNGKPVKLTTTEYSVLRVLAQAQGRMITQQQLLSEVWGPDHADDPHYARIYIGMLRKKLEVDPANPKLILTEPGVGYRLAP